MAELTRGFVDCAHKDSPSRLIFERLCLSALVCNRNNARRNNDYAATDTDREARQKAALHIFNRNRREDVGVDTFTISKSLFLVRIVVVYDVE